MAKLVSHLKHPTVSHHLSHHSSWSFPGCRQRASVRRRRDRLRLSVRAQTVGSFTHSLRTARHIILRGTTMMHHRPTIMYHGRASRKKIAFIYFDVDNNGSITSPIQFKFFEHTATPKRPGTTIQVAIHDGVATYGSIFAYEGLGEILKKQFCILNNLNFNEHQINFFRFFTFTLWKELHSGKYIRTIGTNGERIYDRINDPYQHDAGTSTGALGMTALIGPTSKAWPHGTLEHFFLGSIHRHILPNWLYALKSNKIAEKQCKTMDDHDHAFSTDQQHWDYDDLNPLALNHTRDRFIHFRSRIRQPPPSAKSNLGSAKGSKKKEKSDRRKKQRKLNKKSNKKSNER